MVAFSFFSQFLLGITLLLQGGLSNVPITYGTDIRIVLPDLITVIAVGEWHDDSLVLTNPLEPGRDVRVLISDPATGVLFVPNGYVTASGRDILIEREAESDFDLSLQSFDAEPLAPSYASLRTVLSRQGIDLRIPVNY